MQRLRIQLGFGALGRKPRLLLWLVLISLLFGAIEFGHPLDLALLNIRNKIRAQPASGELVVVGIDAKAMSAAGPWPWKRDHMATLTENLFRAGAARVFFDIFLPPTEPEGDRKLAEALERFPGRIFLATALDTSNNDGTEKAILPAPDLAKSAELVSVTKWIMYWNGVSSIPYRKQLGGVTRRSMESAIAGVDGDVDEEFPVDYSYRLSSIPYVSAGDILLGQGTAAVRGKDVVIGVNSEQLGDVFTVPGQDRAAGVFVIASGTETLKKGRPIALGWIPAWVFALAVSIWFVHGRRLGRALLALGAGVATILIAPLALEQFNIFADIAPALLLVVCTMIGVGWHRFGARKQSQGAMNPVSGLRTVNAILRETLSDSNVIVAIRVRRFADIVSTLPPDSERELVGQIVSRLSIAADTAQLLHGDDGNFFWLLPPAELATLVDQFKAMRLIFRNPIRLAGRSFDVDVAFGVDQEAHMPLSQRLASALAAAHSATEEGHYWKVHDPSASGAREWALSLLGELDQAIEAGHIWVAYQPKMDLAKQALIGAEALVRWTHAARGAIDPAEFVAIAERHGRIDKLTAFVLNEAAGVAATAVKHNPAFTVSVNVSARLLVKHEIVEMVADALHRHRLPAANLVLEVTETAAMAEGQIALSLLEELRAMGVALSIDDYGTGLSTLEYLRRIPASELKVDKRFTASLQSSAEDQAVMRSTIELAHALGMKVVAEGIETEETLDMLRTMGCEIGQGYHIGRPMDWASLLDLVQPPQRWVAEG